MSAPMWYAEEPVGTLELLGGVLDVGRYSDNGGPDLVSLAARGVHGALVEVSLEAGQVDELVSLLTRARSS